MSIGAAIVVVEQTVTSLAVVPPKPRLLVDASSSSQDADWSKTTVVWPQTHNLIPGKMDSRLAWSRTILCDLVISRIQLPCKVGRLWWHADANAVCLVALRHLWWFAGVRWCLFCPSSSLPCSSCLEPLSSRPLGWLFHHTHFTWAAKHVTPATSPSPGISLDIASKKIERQAKENKVLMQFNFTPRPLLAEPYFFFWCVFQWLKWW